MNGIYPGSVISAAGVAFLPENCYDTYLESV